MREQFLEREPPLAGMSTFRECRQIGVRRWPVQVTDRGGQRRHAEAARDLHWQEFHGRFAIEQHERLVRQHAQATLLHTFGRRVDRREAIGRRGIVLAVQEAILGMDHLVARRTAANLAETRHALPLPELCLLCAREVEEPQRELAAAIADAHEQAAATTKDRLREQHLACDEAARARDRGADAHELRAIFIARGQQEQQVVDAIQAELLEPDRERRSDALQVGERRIRLQGSRRPPRRRPSAAMRRRRRHAPGTAA